MEEPTESGERSLTSKEGFVHPPTLVIGLGNPILGDDGVGWRVAEQIKARLLKEQKSGSDPLGKFFVEVDCMSVGGLSLMERLIGYQRAIIIDSITSHQKPIGSVYCFCLEELPKRAAGHLSSSHDTTLQDAIDLGRSMGAKLPDRIIIVAVESQIVYDFSDQMTSPIEAAVPEAEKIVLELLTEWKKSEEST